MKLSLTRTGVAVAAILALGASAIAAAQTPTYQAPRTSDGKPDFQGFWSNVSLTNLERSGQFKSLTIPEADAKRFETQRLASDARGNARSDPTAGAPKAGQDVGGYNNVYVDAGTTYARINGEYRSSGSTIQEERYSPLILA